MADRHPLKWGRAALTVVALALGCSVTPPAGDRDSRGPADPPTLGFARLVVLGGRPFIADLVMVPDVEEISSPGWRQNPVVYLEGDGRQVSFGATAAPLGTTYGSDPFDPTTHVRFTGDGVSVMLHLFQVTATPGQYLVDGSPVTLPAGGLHVFVNGDYLGTQVTSP